MNWRIGRKVNEVEDRAEDGWIGGLGGRKMNGRIGRNVDGLEKRTACFSSWTSFQIRVSSLLLRKQ